MNLPLKFSILIPLIVTLGCTQSNESTTVPSPSYRMTLHAADEVLRLAVDARTSHVSDYLTYHFDEQRNLEYLVSVNRSINEIQFYDLSTAKLAFTIPIATEGPTGIGAIASVEVDDLDSLFVFPVQGDEIFLIGADQDFFKSINFMAPDGYSNAQSGSLYFSANPYVLGDKVFVKALYETNFRTVSPQKLSQTHLGYAIDLGSGGVEFMQHFYPPDYFELGMRHYDFSASFSDNGFVYSFFGDHQLYVSKSAQEKLRGVPGKSQYLKAELPVFPADGDRYDRAQYFSTADHYGNLIYDAYRAVYYRFCYPSVDVEDMQTVRENLDNPQKFSIQIFDKDLNMMGETLFESNQKYLPKNVFVGRRGLYISTKHAKNKHDNEDEFAFALLKLLNCEG